MCAPSWLQMSYSIQYQYAELNNPAYEYQQDRQCTYNVTLRCIHATIVAVQNQ